VDVVEFLLSLDNGGNTVLQVRMTEAKPKSVSPVTT
jgi:hypothetical protein